jgi:carbamate kinase
MIGYLIEQELANVLPPQRAVSTVLTMVEVDPGDPAFAHPTKPIGPVYAEPEARRLAAARGWTVAPDGAGYRRVVPSPRPQRLVHVQPLRWLLERGAIVVCTGGGGIPTARGPDGRLRGVEAVIDKDLASALLARELDADLLVLATDVDGVYVGWQTPAARIIRRATPAALARHSFAPGTMGPKVEAACDFVARTGRVAAIGALGDLAAVVRGEAGTAISPGAAGLEWAG